MRSACMCACVCACILPILEMDGYDMHHVTGVRIVRAMMPSSQGTADMAARPAVGTAVLQEAAMARPEAVRLHGRAALASASRCLG